MFFRGDASKYTSVDAKNRKMDDQAPPPSSSSNAPLSQQ